jgi:hypothetical protein
MKFNPHFGGAQSLICQKLMAYKAFADKVLEIGRQQGELEKALLAQAPEELRDFLAEGWLSSTLEHGISSGRADLTDCNCKNYDAKRKFDKLKRAWAGVINLRFPTRADFKSSGRLELKLSVV